MNSENILFFDVETSTHNRGHPFDPRNFLVSYAYFTNNNLCFKYYSDPDFQTDIESRLRSAHVICGFNIKFDIHWLRNLGITVPTNVKVWDCQLAEFIYSGQEGAYASLNEICEKYGLPTKVDLVKGFWDQGISTENIPLPILEEYNKWDVQLTKMLFDVQQQLLSEKQKRLVYLLGEDLKALQDAEYNGIKFDTDKAREKLAILSKEIVDVEASLRSYLPDEIKNDSTGALKFNYDSGDHVSVLLYGGTLAFDWAAETEAVYKSGAKKGESYIKRSWQTTEVCFKQRFKPLEKSEVKKTRDNPDAKQHFYQVDQPTLSQLKTKSKEDRQLLLWLKERSDKIKVVEMINGLFKRFDELKWEDGLIHPNYNQNVAVTGRLSSDKPNMQNQPPEIDSLLVSRYV